MLWTSASGLHLEPSVKNILLLSSFCNLPLHSIFLTHVYALQQSTKTWIRLAYWPVTGIAVLPGGWPANRLNHLIKAVSALSPLWKWILPLVVFVLLFGRPLSHLLTSYTERCANNIADECSALHLRRHPGCCACPFAPLSSSLEEALYKCSVWMNGWKKWRFAWLIHLLSENAWFSTLTPFASTSTQFDLCQRVAVKLVHFRKALYHPLKSRSWTLLAFTYRSMLQKRRWLEVSRFVKTLKQSFVLNDSSLSLYYLCIMWQRTSCNQTSYGCITWYNFNIDIYLSPLTS